MSPWIRTLPGLALVALACVSPTSGQASTALATWNVTRAPASALRSYDGTVEALRQTVVSAQVAGAIVALPVKVGDRVRAGQLLVRLDARAADHQAGAAAAQVGRRPLRASP